MAAPPVGASSVGGAHAASQVGAKMGDDLHKQARSLAIRLEEFVYGQIANLSQVRELIAQHGLELLFICVIITYLAYYFSQISKVSRSLSSSCLLYNCQHLI